MRKTFVALTAAGLLAIPALPASAQGACTVALSGLSNGQAITGSVNVHGSINAGAGNNVRHIELQVNGSVVRSQDFSGVRSSGSVDYGWSTNGLRNGEYVAKARGNCVSGSDESSVRVYVDNAPSTPSGVSASNNGGTITVSWNGNPEPDITGYRVERDSGGGFQSIGTVGGTSMTDSPGAGSHSYRVVAIRYSPTQGSKSSSPSGASSVTIQAASSGSGDGGSGGSGGGYYQGGGNSGGGYYQGGSGGSGGGYGKGSGNNGNNLPGYGGGSGGKKNGKGGKGGSGGSGNPWGGIGSWGGRNIGGLSLPGQLFLPGSRSALSRNAQDSIDWGQYEENLPYAVGSSGRTGITPEEFLGDGTTASRWDYTVIPPDGLRWVAAGLWFLVAAALLKFLERRLALQEGEEVATGEDAAAAPKSVTGVKAVAAAARKMSLRDLLADEPTASGIVETPKDGDAVSFKSSAAQKPELTVVDGGKEDAA